MKLSTKRKAAGTFALAAAALLSGCGGNGTAAEIKIPILDPNDVGRTTAAAERQNIEEYATVGGTVGYPYAETLSVPCDTNVTEYRVRKGDKLSEGDVIAVFDSSLYDHEYRSAQIEADDAYARWKSSGSELARLEYEQKAKALEYAQYKIDQCTVRAPYDCVVWKAEPLTAGAAVTAGTAVASVAKPGEVFITVKDSTELFPLGREVSLKFGTNSAFSGTVVMEYDAATRSQVQIKLADGELERANAEAGNIAAAGWASVTVLDYVGYDVLCVPEKAVMNYSGDTYCYIMDNDDRVRVPVETGKTVNGMTVVLSGLGDGDIVSY